MIKKIRLLCNQYHGEMILTFANFTSPAVGMLAAVVAAAFIRPEELGAIEAVLLVVPYVSFLQMGVFNGLNRNLAFYKAKGDMATAQRMVNASAFVARWVGIAGGLIALGILISNGLFAQRNPVVIGASISLIIILVFDPMTTHISATYRSGQQFSQLGKIVLVENVLWSLCLFLPVFLGWIGRLVTLAVRSAAGFFLRWRKQPYPAAAEFTRADFKELLHAGAPLLVCNYLWGTLCVADQSLIAIYLGETQLGFYTLSRLLMVAMMVIPSTMGMLLYPRASARYGKTGCRRDLRPFFWKALAVNMLIYAPLCGVAYLLLGPVVEWVLPKYIPGIHAAQINILTCLTFISCGPGVIAGAVKRNTPVMIAYGIGLAAIWSVGLYFCEFRTVSIEIIAMIRFGVSAAVALFVLIYSYRLTEKEGQG